MALPRLFLAIFLAPSIFLMLFIALPLGAVLIRALTLDVVAGFIRPELDSALVLSLSTATLSMLICGVTGVPLGYLMARSSSLIFMVARILIVIPLTIPPLIIGALLLSIYGLTSPIGSFTRVMGVSLTQSPWGIVLSQVFVASPFVVLAAHSAFERVNRHYEYASRILGKNMFTTFLLVSLPLAKRGVFAGLIIAWVRALGEFGATVMMAYNPKTISVQLWEDNAIGGLNNVIPGVLLVLVISFLCLSALLWFGGTTRSSVTLGA